MSRPTLVIDLNRCTGCYSCQVSCKFENGLGLGQRWNRVLTVGPSGKFPNVEMYWLPTQCQQCEDAPCVHVCPTGASYRNEDGVVLVDKSKCIGCKYCMMACPYGVRHYNEKENFVEKCTLCYQRTSAGDEPMCVRCCNAKARFYGDLDDPDSDASKRLAAADPKDVHRLADVGNKPTCAYILSEKYAKWRDLEGLVR